MPTNLSVLTFNVRKLFTPAGPDAAIEAIGAIDPAPDLIACQEVFNARIPGLSHNAKKRLREGFERSGYQTRWLATSWPSVLTPLTLGQGRDGLLVAVKQSRWQLADADYHKMRVGGLSFSRRGCQCVVLREAQGPTIACANTHLAFGVEEKKIQKRVQQGEKILRFLDDLQHTNGVDAMILVGDFNENPDRGVSLLLKGVDGNGQAALRFQDTWTRINPVAPGHTLDPETNTLAANKKDQPGYEGPRRIDHVYLRPDEDTDPNAPLRITASDVVLDEKHAPSGHHLSDHYGVLATFELKAA